jgi:cytochrome P450
MSSAEQTTPALSFASKDLAAYAAQIRAPGGPRAIRVRETGGGRRSAVFVARHEDVVDLLTDEPEFSVCHYAKLFAAVSPPGAYLLMRDESPERTQRYAILNAAKVRTPWFDESATQFTPAVRGLARRIVSTLIDSFRCRQTPQFDVLGEFGGFAPYLVACEVFGIPGPAKSDLLGWLFTQATTFPKFRPFTPETAPYLTQAAWSQLILGQLFADFENRIWPLRLVAGWAEASFRAHIRRRMAAAQSGPPDPEPRDLLSALLLVRRGFPDIRDETYESHVLYLMLELVGTALTVPPTAFAAVAELLFAEGGPRLPLDKLTPENADAFVDEALRLAQPTPSLLRNAVAKPDGGPLSFAGLKLEPDEYVCALVAAAGDDAPNGAAFAPGRPQSAYVHFGPEHGPHRCFGRPIAIPMLGEMLLGLKSLKGLKATGDTTNGPAGPTRLVVSFERGDPASLTPFYPRRPADQGEQGQ